MPLKQQLCKSFCISHCVMWGRGRKKKKKKREREEERENPRGAGWAAFAFSCSPRKGKCLEVQREAYTFAGLRCANPRWVPRAPFCHGNRNCQEMTVKKKKKKGDFFFANSVSFSQKRPCPRGRLSMRPPCHSPSLPLPGDSSFNCRQGQGIRK